MSSVTVRAYKAVERIVADGGDANMVDSEVLSLTEDHTQCMELVDSTDILPPQSVTPAHFSVCVDFSLFLFVSVVDVSSLSVCG